MHADIKKSWSASCNGTLYLDFLKWGRGYVLCVHPVWHSYNDEYLLRRIKHKYSLTTKILSPIESVSSSDAMLPGSIRLM